VLVARFVKVAEMALGLWTVGVWIKLDSPSVPVDGELRFKI
jgi:hypothetical protein